MYEIRPVTRLIQIDALIAIFNYIRPKGFYFPGESHDFWECVYVQEGEVTATADERVYQLGKGQLLLHKPMEYHRIWTGADCAPWIINISFQAHGSLTDKLACRCFDLNDSQKEAFFKIVASYTEFETLLQNDPLLQYAACVNRTAVLLEQFLLELAESKDLNAPSRSPKDARYSQIVQVMQTNCYKNLTLLQLANLCQMSVSNMKRIFQQYSDVGIAKYFLTLRMRCAKELLEQGTPANQVAEILNFPDIPYFYTVFKRETGMTPTQYRKQKSKK